MLRSWVCISEGKNEALLSLRHEESDGSYKISDHNGKVTVPLNLVQGWTNWPSRCS